jgi:hypothetical protein
LTLHPTRSGTAFFSVNDCLFNGQKSCRQPPKHPLQKPGFPESFLSRFGLKPLRSARSSVRLLR